jgi:trehalose synthase
MSYLLGRYEQLLGGGPFRTLEGLARRLRGRRLVMVNTTRTGGGVAEILRQVVPLLNELGIPTDWEIMEGDEAFFRVTKRIHNALHGQPDPLSEIDRERYHEWTRREAARLSLHGDLIFIHDPQPAALIEHRREPGQTWVWRCHIDLSRRDPGTWEFIRPFVEQYDAAIVSAAAFAPPLAAPTFLIAPSIDPFAEKNRELPEEEEAAVLRALSDGAGAEDTPDLASEGPWITQISRFDRLKDPIGVIEAFSLVRKRRRCKLLLAGGGASDDPEGAEVLAEVRERAASVPDVAILELPPGSDLEINALQRAATVVIQKSLREGFALTVAEALWKRRAVVASAVGGIPLQVLHEETGLLARSIEGAAYQIERLLDRPSLRRELGIQGHAHIRENFLHPREMRDYLAVFVEALDRASRSAA